MTTTLRAGSRLGPYEILAPLGAGGMGEVYRARDPRLGREVAIKVLPALVARDPDCLRRFALEARAVAALDHPNVLIVHELATGGEGPPYLVTELLRGETLAQRLLAGPLPLAQVLSLGATVADALAAAHARGIVHRDLKPANLFLTADGRVKVLDFGLAKMVSAAAGDADSWEGTLPGMLLGTLCYMAPEQARGEPVDGRADVYSLALVLHEALTGRRLFARETPPATLVALLEEEPVLGLDAELPAALGALLAGALAKRPEARVATAAALGEGLRALLAELGAAAPLVRAAASGSVARMGSGGPRERSGGTVMLRSDETTDTAVQPTVVKAASGVSTAPGAAVGSARSRARRGPPRTLAVLPFAWAEEGGDAEILADGVAESLIHAFSRLPKLTVMARSTVWRYRGREVDPLAVGRELGVDAVLAGRLAVRGASLTLQVELVDPTSGTLLWSERLSRGLGDLVAMQEELGRELAERLRPRLSPAGRRRLARELAPDSAAYHPYLRGRFCWNKWTADGMRQAIAHYEEAIALDPRYARAWAGLADAWAVLGNIKALPPADAYPRAKDAARQALGLDPELAEAHASLGYVHRFFDWDWPAAEAALARAVALDPRYATGRRWYGQFLSGLGRHHQAIAECKAALALEPLSLIIHTAVGDVLYYARRYDEAIGYYRRAVELDPNFLAGHSDLARALEAKGEVERAIHHYEQALRLDTSANPDPSVGLANAYALADRLGSSTGAGGRDGAGRARSILAELERRRAGGGFVSAWGLAGVYCLLGEHEVALDWLERAYAERDSPLVWLAVHPRLDPLRGHPRYAALREQMRLPAV